MVVLGVFVTALYSFRMFFLVFHGEERMDEHTRHHLKESPWVVTVPLILLAIPSVVIGAMTVGPLLFGDFFEGVLYVLPEHDTLGKIEYHGVLGFALHGMLAPPFFLAMAGLATAWYVYMINPAIADKVKAKLQVVYLILDRKYWMDEIFQFVFAGGSRGIGKLLWKFGDLGLIDGVIVNGSARGVDRVAGLVRQLQTGYLYHYAIAMILGLLALLIWFVIV
jgi:NADH-quinone oxidoreductase subunit L